MSLNICRLAFQLKMLRSLARQWFIPRILISVWGEVSGNCSHRWFVRLLLVQCGHTGTHPHHNQGDQLMPPLHPFKAFSGKKMYVLIARGKTGQMQMLSCFPKSQSHYSGLVFRHQRWHLSLLLSMYSTSLLSWLSTGNYQQPVFFKFHLYPLSRFKKNLNKFTFLVMV